MANIQVDLDGRWIDKKTKGVNGIIMIEGGTIYHEGNSLPLMPQGGASFAITLEGGEFLHARLEEDRLLWDDGDVWVLMGHRAAQSAGASAAEMSRARMEDLQHQADAAANAARSAAAMAGLSIEVQASEASLAVVLAAAAGAQAAGVPERVRVAVPAMLAHQEATEKTPLVLAFEATERRRHGAEGCDMADYRKVLDVFKKFDQDGSGQVSCSELRSSLQVVDKRLFSDQACRKLFKHLDADNSGALDVAELWAWIYSGDLSGSSQALHSASVDVPTNLDGCWLHRNQIEIEEIIENGKVITEAAPIPIRTMGNGIYIQLCEGDASSILRAKVERDALVWEDGDIWLRCDADVAAVAAEAARKAAVAAGLSRQEQARHAEKAAISATAINAQWAGFDSRAIAKKVAAAKRKYGKDGRAADHEKVSDFLMAADSDGNGDVSVFELRRMLQSINAKRFTDEACAEVFQLLDSNKNGSVDVAELCTWIYAEDDWLSWAMISAAVRPSAESDAARDQARCKKG